MSKKQQSNAAAGLGLAASCCGGTCRAQASYGAVDSLCENLKMKLTVAPVHFLPDTCPQTHVIGIFNRWF
ncbi:hypothetical protein [Paenibacillus agaridevorans]|uniref:hypothetical protein n=1 Tax=Paenibacillus agaridevorans TaxID=171404 RepID=UPI0011B1DA49|nr:hypothetical protein [Paenibacillus agaridevorans]